MEEPCQPQSGDIGYSKRVGKPAQPLPPLHTADTLSTACDRVGAGHLTVGGRWGDMTLSKAQLILRDACTELIALRSERRELICGKCLTIWSRDELIRQVAMRPQHPESTKVTYTIDHCPKCGGYLRTKAMVMEAALRQQVDELQERVTRLQDSLTAILDLELEAGQTAGE